jgi:actin-related protein
MATEPEGEGNLDTVVIDIGSRLAKAGFSGDDAPRAVFPTLIASPDQLLEVGKPYFCADDARNVEVPHKLKVGSRMQTASAVESCALGTVFHEAL